MAPESGRSHEPGDGNLGNITAWRDGSFVHRQQPEKLDIWIDCDLNLWSRELGQLIPNLLITEFS